MATRHDGIAGEFRREILAEIDPATERIAGRAHADRAGRRRRSGDERGEARADAADADDAQGRDAGQCRCGLEITLGIERVERVALGPLELDMLGQRQARERLQRRGRNRARHKARRPRPANRFGQPDEPVHRGVLSERARVAAARCEFRIGDALRQRAGRNEDRYQLAMPLDARRHGGDLAQCRCEAVELRPRARKTAAIAVNEHQPSSSRKCR